MFFRQQHRKNHPIHSAITPQQFHEIQALTERNTQLARQMIGFYAIIATFLEMGGFRFFIERNLSETIEKLAYDIHQYEQLSGTLLSTSHYERIISNIDLNYRLQRGALTLSSPLLYFVSNAILLYFKSYFVTVHDVSNAENLNSQEASELIEKLTKHNQELEGITKRNLSLIYSLLMPLSIYILMQLMFEERIPTQSVSLLFTVLLVTKLTFKGSSPAVKPKDLSSLLREKEKDLKAAFPTNLKYQCQWEEGALPQLSQLTLQFDAYYFDKTRRLAPRMVAQIIKNILMSEGVKIVSFNKTTLVIAADAPIHKMEIKQKIEACFERHYEILKLTQQLYQINKIMSSSVISIPALDNEGLRINRFYFELPQRFKNAMPLTVLKELFPQCEIQVHQENFLIVSGFKACTHTKAFDLLISNLKACHPFSTKEIESENKEKRNETEKAPSEKIIHKKGKKHLESKVERLKKEIEEEKKSQLNNVQHIKWRAGTFDSNNKNCKIYPITGAGIPHNTFFICSALKAKDLKDYPHAFDKIGEDIKKAHIAPGRKGAQGVVFTEPEVKKDTKGHSFNSHAMLKILGTFNDMRVYLDSQKAATGEELFIARGFEAHVH